MRKNPSITTDDILIKLCHSLADVLSVATESQIKYSPMVQKINKTSLKPQVLVVLFYFDGGFHRFSRYQLLCISSDGTV